MKVLNIVIGLVLFMSATLSAQHIHTSKCGVTAEDQQLMERLHPNDFRGDLSTKRQETTYIPVKFHITSNTDGTGAVEMVHVLNQLCILNQDYASSNMVFYIYDGFSFIKQTNIYTSAGSNINAVKAKKNLKAANIFITENADLSSNTEGTTLGFYSPDGDYVIVRKKELIDKSNTLSHEAGHFFSLRHTFYGWEGAYYDKNIHGETVTFTTVPGGIPGIAVELMDMSNCTTAADMICDTPPDYNFGLTANNCIFNQTVYDKNGDKVIPMKENQMGYFSGCDTFKFTDGQANRMLTNFNSSSRNYLRSAYVPNTDEIVGDVNIVSPSSGEKISTFDYVRLDWDDVPGASQYLVEIRGLSQYFWAIVSSSEYLSTELKKNNFYTFSVRPFNEGNACSTAKTSNFRTGEGTISSTSQVDVLKEISVVPNPVSSFEGMKALVKLSQASLVTLNVTDMFGRQLHQKEVSAVDGMNTIDIDISTLNTGVYFLVTKVQGSSKLTKFIVQ